MSPITPPPKVMIVDGAVGVGAHQRVVDARHGRELLEALAVGDEDRLGDRDRARASCGPCSRHTSGLETTKRRAGAPIASSVAAEAVEHAIADRHGVRA